LTTPSISFGSIRLPPHSLSMFEAVINAVHRAAPDAAIAFNTRRKNLEPHYRTSLRLAETQSAASQKARQNP
jgi:hypothetical protein